MNKQGFSLIELVVIIALSGVIIVMINDIFFSLGQSQRTIKARAELEQNLIIAMDSIVDDLKNGFGLISYQEGYLLPHEIVIFSRKMDTHGKMKNQSITYKLAIDPQLQSHPFGLQGAVLYRAVDNGQNQPIANYLGEMTFQYFNTEGQAVDRCHDVAQVSITLKGMVFEQPLIYQQQVTLKRWLWSQ